MRAYLLFLTFFVLTGCELLKIKPGSIKFFDQNKDYAVTKNYITCSYTEDFFTTINEKQKILINSVNTLLQPIAVSTFTYQDNFKINEFSVNLAVNKVSLNKTSDFSLMIKSSLKPQTIFTQLVSEESICEVKISIPDISLILYMGMVGKGEFVEIDELQEIDLILSGSVSVEFLKCTPPPQEKEIKNQIKGIIINKIKSYCNDFFPTFYSYFFREIFFNKFEYFYMVSYINKNKQSQFAFAPFIKDDSTIFSEKIYFKYTDLFHENKQKGKLKSLEIVPSTTESFSFPCDNYYEISVQFVSEAYNILYNSGIATLRKIFEEEVLYPQLKDKIENASTLIDFYLFPYNIKNVKIYSESGGLKLETIGDFLCEGYFRVSNTSTKLFKSELSIRASVFVKGFDITSEVKDIKVNNFSSKFLTQSEIEFEDLISQYIKKKFSTIFNFISEKKIGYNYGFSSKFSGFKTFSDKLMICFELE